MTTSDFNLKASRLAAGLSIILFPLIANAVNLMPDIDYNLGNGTGAPIAEAVSCYAHKDDALDHFTQRRAEAIKILYSNLGGKEDLFTDLEEKLKAKYGLLAMDPRYASGSGERVRFFTCSGLEKCQVFLINGKFYHYGDQATLDLYNSGIAVLDGMTGDIIVMDEQGNIFIHPKVMGKIHHSSFFSQKPIAFGAMVRIKDGEIVRSNFIKDDLSSVTLFPDRVRSLDYPDGLFYYSGHYDPKSGSSEMNTIKQDAFNNFKSELDMIQFEIKTDLQLSKEIFLISGINKSKEEMLQSKQGVMTLCFNISEYPGMPTKKGDAALVFEMVDENSTEISACMISFCRDLNDNCCYLINHYVSLDGHDGTIQQRCDYANYASWILPQEDLLKGYNIAQEDANTELELSCLKNSVIYVSEIMKKVGIKKGKFGCWRTTRQNLKVLVNNYMEPRADIFHETK